MLPCRASRSMEEDLVKLHSTIGHDQTSKLALGAASEESRNEVYAAQKPASTFTRWFRSPLFNVIVVGLISFTQPGIWDALNRMWNTARCRGENMRLTRNRYWCWGTAGALLG